MPLITETDAQALWGSDGVRYLPFDKISPHIAFDLDTVADNGVMPRDVPVLFTTDQASDVATFAILDITLGDQDPFGLIVLGTVPGEPSTLYCLDCRDGSVYQLDLDQPAMELVNTTHGAFVQFLYRIHQFLTTGHGPHRPAAAGHLRAQLAELDPAAFTDTESWWSLALGQLAHTP